jgi:hypothetical protein
MTHQNEAQPAHAILHAGHTGVVVSQLFDEDWTPTADPSSNAFTETIDGVLYLTADLARRLIGAHQAAAAQIIESKLDRLDHQQDDRDEQVGTQGEHANLSRHRPDRPPQFRQGWHQPCLFLYMCQCFLL